MQSGKVVRVGVLGGVGRGGEWSCAGREGVEWRVGLGVGGQGWGWEGGGEFGWVGQGRGFRVVVDGMGQGVGGCGLGAVGFEGGGLKFLESALFSGYYILLRFHQNRRYFNFQGAEPPITGLTKIERS